MSIADINDALFCTKFTDKTKSLHSYAKSGLRGELIRIYILTQDAGICEADALPLALYVYNAVLNGGTLPGTIRDYYDSHNHTPNADDINTAYKHIRTKTLDDWRKAVQAIDEYKRKFSVYYGIL